MELRHIRYFCAVAETLNFTRAAEQLHVAQPPLSRQIQQLEDELGVCLLQRGRPMRLTEAGRFFYDHAAQILQQVSRLASDTQRIDQGQRRWLNIGFAPSTLYGPLPELIRRLRSNGDTELGLSEMVTLEQVEALKSGRIDIGFGRIHINDPSIVQRVILEDELVAVLPAGHRLIGTSVSLEQLAEESFVLYPGNPRPSYADQVLGIFAGQHLKINVAQMANELQTAIGLVAAGIGITVVPASVQRLHRADIGYASIQDASARSPIIVSQRIGDESAVLRLCLKLVDELLVEAAK